MLNPPISRARTPRPAAAPTTLSLRTRLPSRPSVALVAASALLTVLGLIPNEMFLEPGPWIKIVYATTLALAAAWLVSRLGKPGASGAQAMYAFAGVILIMVCAGFNYFIFR